MEAAVIIALVLLLTSATAGKIGTTWLGLNSLSLRRAGLQVLESVGIAAAFYVANLAAGMIIIALADALTGRFVSHYILRDITIVNLSLLQGMVFAWWHSTSKQFTRLRSE